MHANCYIDFKVLGSKDDGNQLYLSVSKVLHVLHGAFSKNEGKYALALPHSKQGKQRSFGDVIRVFASSSADLYALCEAIKGHTIMSDYVNLTMVKDVPADFKGTWSIWRRIRVQKKEGPNRIKTIERAQASPFAEIRSKSNGNRFALRIHREVGYKQLVDCLPTSYGLSGNGECAFALPDI